MDTAIKHQDVSPEKDWDVKRFIKTNETSFLLRNRYSLGFILLCIVGYLLLRLPNLTLQPIFVDEAIYIRWAQIMRAEPTLRFISVSDGKTPLFMWMMIPFLKLFHDPLFAGRFLSVCFGLTTLLGNLFLGWRFFNNRVGLWAAFFSMVTPYIVFFDRMALVDATLAAFSIWSLNLTLLLVKYLRFDLAMVLGFSLGGGMLVKTPALMNLVAVPLSLISFNWAPKGRVYRILKLGVLWMIAFIIAMGMYNILRLGPEFDHLSSRNQDYLRSPLLILQNPLDPFIPHLRDVVDWFTKLLTLPIVLLLILGVWNILRTKHRDGMVILLWALFPFIAQMFLLQTFTARYLLPSITPFLTVAGVGAVFLVDYLKKKIKVSSPKLVIPAVLGLIVSILPLYFDLSLLKDPLLAPLPREERSGYLEEWTAGYGFPEIAQYLTEQSQTSPIVVGTQGSFGTLPDGLWIYLDKTPNITIIPGGSTVSDQIIQASKDHKTFYVSHKKGFNPPSFLHLLKEFPKAVGEKGEQDSILLFEVEPESLNS